MPDQLVDATALAQAEAYRRVRSLTERLAAPLSAEDQTVQSMPDVSPTKWHRAHVTWFFETFLLKPYRPGYREFDPRFGFLFNSYYEGVGARYPRAERGNVSRPGVAEVGAYRAYVDRHMIDLVAELDDDHPAAALIELGLHHEQQHQELLLMDIKHVLSRNPAFPAYDARTAVASGGERASELSWSSFDGGVVEVGHATAGFSFDNETPRHRVYLEPYRLANRLVTAGEWIEFIDAGGYDDPLLWLSDGWHASRAEGWAAPLYWHRRDDRWHVFTLQGLRPLDPAEPVAHVSHYEADAFARWAGARLATEAEWEHAAAGVAPCGNFVESGLLHPSAARAAAGTLTQMFGDLWEWTASAYLSYPGFAPAPGAVGEYNGKFMSNQMVLRGGCCATPGSHIRASYRNFFYPAQRWMFSGVRLAASV